MGVRRHVSRRLLLLKTWGPLVQVTSRMKYEMKVHEPIKNHMFSSNRTQRRR